MPQNSPADGASAPEGKFSFQAARQLPANPNFRSVILSAAKDPEALHVTHTASGFRCTDARVPIASNAFIRNLSEVHGFSRAGNLTSRWASAPEGKFYSQAVRQLPANPNFRSVILSAAKDPEALHATHTASSFRCTEVKARIRIFTVDWLIIAFMPKPLKNILEKRGHFWWHDKQIIQDHLFPTNAVPGMLTIDGNGLARLKLENPLSETESLVNPSSDQEEITTSTRSIAGRLAEDGVKVYLENILRRDGSSQLLNHATSYRANYCLVGSFPGAYESNPLRATQQSISLKGLEAWIWSDSIDVKLVDVEGTNHTQEVRYRLTRYPYSLGDANLVLRSDVYRNPLFDMGKSRQVTFTQEDWLDYLPAEPASVAEMKQQFMQIEEFLTLLIGSYYHFDWPLLSCGEDKTTSYTLYFWRSFEVSSAPEMTDIWITFPQVRELFGSLFFAWKEKCKQYGPGFYLYLAALRNSSLYIEHRFVNLVWGIEALHRKSKTSSQENLEVKARVDEILSCISEQVKPQTKKWLERKLKLAEEPNLEKRIYEVLASPNLGFKEKPLKHFAKRCADRRNEISHFGGSKLGEDRDSFLRDLQQLDYVLSFIYHAVLLHEIGLDNALLRKCFYCHPISFKICPVLKELGLVTEADIEQFRS